MRIKGWEGRETERGQVDKATAIGWLEEEKKEKIAHDSSLGHQCRATHYLLTRYCLNADTVHGFIQCLHSQCHPPREALDMLGYTRIRAEAAWNPQLARVSLRSYLRLLTPTLCR